MTTIALQWKQFGKEMLGKIANLRLSFCMFFLTGFCNTFADDIVFVPERPGPVVVSQFITEGCPNYIFSIMFDNDASEWRNDFPRASFEIRKKSAGGLLMTCDLAASFDLSHNIDFVLTPKPRYGVTVPFDLVEQSSITFSFAPVPGRQNSPTYRIWLKDWITKRITSPVQ